MNAINDRDWLFVNAPRGALPTARSLGCLRVDSTRTRVRCS
jgi:hypothetical protein